MIPIIWIGLTIYFITQGMWIALVITWIVGLIVSNALGY